MTQNLFFFFAWACFFAASSFFRLSSARFRSAFSSGVSSWTSLTGDISITALDGGGEDGGSAVGDCVVLIRLVLGEIVIARWEASPSTSFALPPIRKGLRAFFGVITDWVACEEGTNSLVVKTVPLVTRV